MKKIELKKLIEEEIQNTLKSKALKSKALRRINIAKKKYMDNGDWGGIADYDVVIKKLQNINDPERIELLVRWYEGDPNIKTPLDKI